MSLIQRLREEDPMHVSVPYEAIVAPPHVKWRHIDGPMMTWAGHIHWLTLRERIAYRFGFITIDEIADRRFQMRSIRAHAMHVAALRNFAPTPVYQGMTNLMSPQERAIDAVLTEHKQEKE